MAKKGKINKETGQLACPKCGCTSLSDQKKGYGIGKGVVGAAVLGPIGLIAGNIGKQKIVVKCMHCGNKWTV
ncbi:MAG: hypothetical protein ACERKZ_05545 [Lachnotalea sp.]